MQIRNPIPSAFLVALLAVATVGAQTVTLVDTTLGGTFSGVVDSSTGEMVQARFEAAGGEAVTLTVQAARGSSVVLAVTIRDPGGAPLSSGSTRIIPWMGVANLTHTFTIPAVAGMYTAEISAQSGSASFTARLSGTPVNLNRTTVGGTVKDSLTGASVGGASITVAGGSYATTDSSGAFSGELMPGTYNFVVTHPDYQTLTTAVTVSAGTSITDLEFDLVPLIPVAVSTGVSGDMDPGGVVMPTVDVLTLPGTDVNSITWQQIYGAPASISGGDTATPTVTLGGLVDFKDTLVERLEEPPVTEDDLPPNVPLPSDYPAGLQNRLRVVGINPFALEEAAVVTFEVEVDTTAGVFTDEVEVHVRLPWKVAPGLRNVPLMRPVILRAKEHTSYNWTLNGPPGSGAMLVDATTRHPYFTPDVPGTYELELDEVASGSTTLELYAGMWYGTIVDQDMDGRPLGDVACMTCHNGSFLEDTFADWSQTGHAEIFTDNINSSAYWGTQCFQCHTVGYDPDAGVDNGGIDDIADFQDFLDSGLIGNPTGDNWDETLAQFPDVARMANIQCENCHGPQQSNAHGFAGPLGEPRVDLSSDVCATCHGEPLRHARFQQWQLSPHANYELAIDEANSGSCSRCHTANGFLAWLPVLLDDDPATDPLDNVTVTWTVDEAHPQTCATCHDPHAAGTTSGNDNNATVRISGDTPPLIAGFQVDDVGRGAICMTCHNSRRGLRNDSVWDDFSTSEKARAPHGGTQTDMLVGQNAYLVPVDTPGSHRFITDTCAECHMVRTPPPDALAYNSGGTNHTFLASTEICAECHSDHLTADVVTEPIENLMHVVEGLMEDALFELIDGLVNSGYGVDLNGRAFITDTSLVADIQFTETRGRQAMTVTFTDTTVVGPYRMTDIDVLAANMDPIDLCDGATNVCTISGGDCTDDSDCGVVLYDFAEDDMMKAGWNLLLVHSDGSRGIHNPLYASNVLSAARDALANLGGPSRMLQPRFMQEVEHQDATSGTRRGSSAARERAAESGSLK